MRRVADSVNGRRQNRRPETLCARRWLGREPLVLGPAVSFQFQCRCAAATKLTLHCCCQLTGNRHVSQPHAVLRVPCVCVLVCVSVLPGGGSRIAMPSRR